MFRKITSCVILIVLLISLFPAISAYADSQGQINSDYVRFRSGPGTDYSIIKTYSSGKTVTILEYSDQWTRCRVDGVSGYIFSDYITADQNTPISTPPQLIISPPTPEPETSVGIIIVPAPTQDPVPTQDPIPTQVPIPTPAPIQDPIPTQIPIPTPAPTQVPSPTPAPTPSPAPMQQTGAAGTITGDYVRFRSGPSTSNAILASYNKGKALTVTGISGDWTQCVIDGKSGYVFSQYVKTGEQQPSPSIHSPAPVQTVSSSAGYITGNNVRFREGPSLDAKIIGEFYYANGVNITGTDGDWTKVMANGSSGYVFSKYVKTGSYSAVSQHTESPSPSPLTDSVVASSGNDIANYAMQFLGTKYSWGGKDPSTGFDCSGLVWYVYQHFGINMNRVAKDQALNGSHVDAADIQPGDVLCFYSSGTYIGHTGIYIGEGKFIHAATSTTGVIITELQGNYYKRGFEARRII